jgi:hypothetical protein
MKYVIERWTGKAWYPSLCSPYKTMGEINNYLKKYAWHYTTENPYRIKDYKPKKKTQKYVPKFSLQDWNSDQGMVVKI